MIRRDDIEALLEIAREAGAEIMEVYGSDDFGVEEKEDASPLTEADRRGNAVIVDGLGAGWPEIPILSEETKAAPYEERRHWERFWLVDPLDGTKEFIKRNGEFTVNIALVEEGEPVFGVVYRPVTDEAYFNVPGEGSYKQEGAGEWVALSGGKHYKDLEKVTVVASRSHMSDAVTEFVEGLKAEGKEVEFLSAGSSLKLCLVAEGLADVYPRLGPTMEWDTGAAHAVALGAGRVVVDAEKGEDLRYNKEDLLNPWFIVE